MQISVLPNKGGSPKLLMKIFYITLGFMLPIFASSISTSLYAAEEFRDNKMSSAKLNYCEALTKRFGHRSYDRNASWREAGLSFDRPKPSHWELDNINEPGWFSDELWISYHVPDYATPYDQHGTACQWSESGFFTFYIDVWDYGLGIECVLPGDLWGGALYQSVLNLKTIPLIFNRFGYVRSATPATVVPLSTSIHARL